MDEFKKATPRPWVCKPANGTAVQHGLEDEWSIYDGRGFVLASGLTRHDAALIVRAVNTFGPMREALAELEEAVSTGAAPFKPEYALEWMIREGGEATVKPELLLKCVRALRAANGEGER